ncbi:MAG: hypothetical protein HQM12_14920 [SAR324 cluster bacterium]|nr:hypothetical protein [SAR324 cluster bacterium]
MTNSFNVSVLISIFLWSAISAVAGEPEFLRQSIRARGMGNAFTAVANDEMLLYYNPAGLRSLTHNLYELYSANGTSNEDTINLATEDDQVAGLADIAGRKIFLETTLLSMSHHNTRWGVALFSNAIIDLSIHNPIVPYLSVRAFGQAGVLGGMAFSFMDQRLDIGVGLKAVNRTGMIDTLHITDEAIIAFVDRDETDLLEDKYASTTQVGTDVGMIYHVEDMYNLFPKLAVVIRNIGDMDFEQAGLVPMTVDLGLATESEVQGVDITFAMDYQDLLNANDLASGIFTIQNLKIGVEVGLEKMYNGHHFFSFRAGRNGPYNTFGATLNPAWTLLYIVPKIDFALWSQEIGQFGGDVEDQRTSLQISWMF